MKPKVKVLLEGLSEDVNKWLLQFCRVEVVTSLGDIQMSDSVIIPDSSLRINILQDVVEERQPSKLILLGNMSKLFALTNDLNWEPGVPRMSGEYKHGSLAYSDTYGHASGMEYHTVTNSESIGMITDNRFGIIFRTYITRDQFNKKEDVDKVKGFPIVHQHRNMLACTHIPFRTYHRKGSFIRRTMGIMYGDVGTNRIITQFLEKNEDHNEGFDPETVRVGV